MMSVQFYTMCHLTEGILLCLGRIHTCVSSCITIKQSNSDLGIDMWYEKGRQYTKAKEVLLFIVSQWK